MIHVVVALRDEARPVAEYFGLTGAPPRGSFRLYEGHWEDQSIRLIVSGLGKVAAASAVAYLQASVASAPHDSESTPPTAWLNLGICGHGTRPIGDALIGHKIVDVGSGRTWYPPLVFSPPCTTDNVFTSDRVDRQYRHPGAVEQEAAGFYATAVRFSMSELVQVFKVVSDNPTSPITDVGPKMAARLIADRLSTVAETVRRLELLARQLPSTALEDHDCDEFRRHVHLTVTEERQLRSLVRRWRALEPNRSAWSADLLSENQRDRGKEVLARLAAKVANLPVRMAPVRKAPPETK